MVVDGRSRMLAPRRRVAPLGLLAAGAAGAVGAGVAAPAWIPARLVAIVPLAATGPARPAGKDASGAGAVGIGAGQAALRSSLSAAGLLVAAAATVALGAESSRSRPGRGAERWSGRRRHGVVALRVASTEVRTGLGVNPANCWPEGKPRFTTEYPEVYDLSDPKGSFERVGKRILEEMTEELPELYELPKKEVDWVSHSLEYNTLGGKMNRGLIVVETGCELMKHQGLEPSNRDLNRFAVLGWAVELLQACMLMADDMMDGSLTRRGSPCWYRLPTVGLLATNDFLMVEMFVYKVLKRHFGEEEYFLWLVDLFLETTFQTECGQLLDSICANCELEELTTDRWTLLVKYKTAFYSFYLPVALAMLVCGIRERKAFDSAREALLLMGIYFQAQDDFLDAFACPEVLGKVGTDIQDKKCSWLFAHAYHEHGTDEARAMLDKYYGKCKVGSEEEDRIKDLYRELGLQELFQKYEEEVQQKLERYRAEVEKADLPWSIFERFFALIYKRRK